MKKLFKLSILVSVLTVIFSLTSCNNKEKIIVGTMAEPGQPILEYVESKFEEETGYDLEIQIYTDFATPNNALAAGEIDANLFQHAPYLNTYNTNNDTDLAVACIMYDCAYGVYSKKITTLDAIPDGAKVTIANDASNMKRCLDLLDAEGLIEVDYGTTEASALNPDNVNDYIKTNSKSLVITPMNTNLIASSLDDEDVYLGIVNATYALAADLESNATLLTKEVDTTHTNANILAARSSDLDKDWLKTLVSILTSSDTDNFVSNKFNGVITPYHG